MTNLCTAEISLYPLNKDFYSIIGEFIQRMQEYAQFEIEVMTTCTHIRGEYAPLFSALQQEIQRVHQEYGQAILCCKFLLGNNVGVGIYNGE